MHQRVDSPSAEQLEQATRYLCESTRVAALTGAGISAESGLATFRGAGGLWEGHRVENVATPEAFERDPKLVWRFYNARRAAIAAVKPNPGHLALVELAHRFGDAFTLVTQNVDGLHQTAGSQRVHELHGNLRQVRCTGCGRVDDRGLEPLPELPTCSVCRRLLRPNVVWFNEMLPTTTWEQAESAVSASDCLLVIGTSAVVYPAAGLILLARERGARIIEVNLTTTNASDCVHLSLRGPSGSILPEIVQRTYAAKGF
jgi:NAD-dependent deacetylase